MGVFARIMVGLAVEANAPKTIKLEATFLKARRTASSLRVKKGGVVAPSGTRWAASIQSSTPSPMPKDDRSGSCLGAGQVSDYTEAMALLGVLPNSDWLLADRGYDADWFRETLRDSGIKTSIPGRRSRGTPVRHDKRRYKRRH